MQSRVYETVRPSVRPSACPFHRSTAAPLAGGFAAERPAGSRYRSTAAGAAYRLQARSAATAPQHGAQEQMRAVSR